MDLRDGSGPLTDSCMLRRLRDLQDQDAWSKFFDIYATYLAGVLRRRSIPDQDIPDSIQETFVTLMDRIGDFQYDRSKRFRCWLATIALRKAWQMRRKGGKLGLRAQGGTTNVMALGDLAGSWDDWDRMETRLQIALRRARALVSPVEWRAFQLTVLESMENKAAAEVLGITVGNLYVCKSRVKSTLERVLEETDE
jgi:RNA polymerase sigma-70 factor, ECF subfamily